jgi:hypothetical protein
MPPINGVATVGVIAVSVAVAAAIAIYESPELQRMASDLRRRIASALHNFGDSISPEERANLFNRPEDAEVFLASRGLGRESVPGVEADPESLRRQREELMYWNALREAKKEKEHADSELSEKKGHRSRASSSFDDFLQQDGSEKGAFVFHQSGHEAHHNEGQLTRRRGTDGLRGLNHSVYTNPFADEHGIEDDIAFENSLMDPEKDEMSDIYSATDLGAQEPPRTINAILSQEDATRDAVPALIETAEPLPDYSEMEEKAPQESQSQSQSPSTPQTLGREPSESELGPDEYMTAGQESRNETDVYSSIQAWAQSASHNASFYSPLPASTAAPSEADIDIVSEAGFMTPTDTASVAGSGVEIATEEVESNKSFDVMSDDGSVLTPTSWSEVGSVVSESEAGRQAVRS